jgi:hypothetical protein
MSEMVIFSRTFDFLSWLIPKLESFPRSQRFGVTKRLQDAALDFYETITAANNCRGAERQRLLRQADEHLDKVRFYLRLVTRWAWLSRGQYQHAAQMVAEIGRLLGGWQKAPERDNPQRTTL